MEPQFRHPMFDESARRFETALQASPVHHRACRAFSDLIPRTPGGRPTGQQVIAALEAAGLVATEFIKADGARVERAERLRVMTELGGVLAEELGVASARRALDGLFIAMAVCKEDTELLRRPQRDTLEDVRAALAPLVARAEQVLLLARIAYEGEAGHGAATRLEIYTHRDGEPFHTTIEHRLSWEEVPPDLRERFVGDGKQVVRFKLYGQEG